MVLCTDFVCERFVHIVACTRRVVFTLASILSSTKICCRFTNASTTAGSLHGFVCATNRVIELWSSQLQITVRSYNSSSDRLISEPILISCQLTKIYRDNVLTANFLNI
ncbi:hypothetical protein ACOSQ3_027795 [Xanthoceras sorbifolium]